MCDGLQQIGVRGGVGGGEGSRRMQQKQNLFYTQHMFKSNTRQELWKLRDVYKKEIMHRKSEV